MSNRFGTKVGRQFRVWLPTMPLTMVSARNATATHPAWAIFRTPPRMTKHEIKEHLTKIYNLPVKNVNTMNYEGKRKRILTQSKTVFYKYSDFKKAVVTFDATFKDIGLGMRIPELEEEEAAEAAAKAEGASGNSTALSATKRS